MTREEHLLTILAEECAEVAQRASKILRFGFYDVEPGQDLSNTQRLRGEFAHILATYEMIGLQWPTRQMIDEKKTRVEQFFEYSKERGRLEE